MHLDTRLGVFACLYVLLSVVADVDAACEDRSLFCSTSAVVDLINLDLLSLHESAGFCPWMLIAYSDGCGHCRQAAPSIARLAEETFANTTDVVHQVTVAAVNCPENTAVCHELGVQGVPSFFLFTPNTLAATEPTLSPIVLHARGEAGATATLHRFAIGRGGDVDTRFDLARTIWGQMTNGTWGASSRERCVDMRSFLRNARQSELVSQAPEASAQAGVVRFTEDREFHSVDVANAFFHTLYHEVALVGLESAERRYALYRFLSEVQQRLPGLGADVILHELAAYNTSTDAAANPADLASIAVEDWQRLVLEARIPFQGSPRNLAWRTCKGSSWRYRGFPCGQWLLYHALTANAESQATATTATDNVAAAAHVNTEILFIIKDYVRSFFSCENCRHHFARFEPNRVTDPVLQLWEMHNSVNVRLASVVEGADPFVPKRLFPGFELCPRCYRDSGAATKNPDAAVIESEMLNYLRGRYHWKPGSLYAATSTTTAGPHAGTADAAGSDVIVVHKAPLRLSVFLTIFVVVVTVLLAMLHVLRRARTMKAKKHRPLVHLRMQP